MRERAACGGMRCGAGRKGGGDSARGDVSALRGGCFDQERAGSEGGVAPGSEPGGEIEK